MDATKTCKQCGETKPVDAFYTDGKRLVDGTPGRKPRCKACHSLAEAERIKNRGRHFRDWIDSDLWAFTDDMENVVKCLVAWRNRVAPEEGRMLGQAAQLIQFAKDFSEEKRHEQKQKKHWSSVS